MASHLRAFPTRALLSHSSNCTFPILSRAIISKRPAIPLRNSVIALPTPSHLSQQRKTMATTEAPKKIEWLVVVPDFPGAQEKRLEVRPQHFANLEPNKENGMIQMGGAVLNEPPTSADPSTFSFAGSTLVVMAATREEVKEFLRTDIYAEKKVWDVENAQMWPFLCAFRNHK